MMMMMIPPLYTMFFLQTVNYSATLLFLLPGKYFRVVLFLCSNYMLNRLRKKNKCCFNWLAEEERRLPAGPLSDNYNGL